MSLVEPGTGAAGPAPRKRRLKPEIVARLIARKNESRLEQLYARQVDELSPEELQLMKANFLRG